MFFRRMSGHVTAFTAQLQLVPLSQFGHEPFIFVRLSPTQLVIEVNHRKNNANFLAQFQQQTEQGNRVRASRNRDPHAIPGLQKFMFPNVCEYTLPQPLHGNIVQPQLSWAGSLLVMADDHRPTTNDCSFSSSP